MQLEQRKRTRLRLDSDLHDNLVLPLPVDLNLHEFRDYGFCSALYTQCLAEISRFPINTCWTDINEKMKLNEITYQIRVD